MATTSEVEGLRICKTCGPPAKPIGDFVKGKGGSGRLFRCKACQAAKRREEYQRRPMSTSTGRGARAARRAQLGDLFVEQAPDPQAARLLAEILIYDREYGLGFDAVWAENVDFVLNAIHGKGVLQEREDWAAAFRATRTAFEAAWQRTPGPGAALSPALLDALSG